MKALGDGAPVPKAFPLHSQYVANMKASREAAAEGEGGDQAVDSSGDEGSEKPENQRRSQPKKPERLLLHQGHLGITIQFDCLSFMPPEKRKG